MPAHRPDLYDAPEVYDAAFSWDPSVEAEFYGRLFREFLGKGRGQRIVEFGCGTGRILRMLSALGFSCFGVDISSGMARFAHEKSRHEPIDVAVADMAQVPARNESVAGAISTLSTISYLSEEGLSLHLEEADRVLSERGIYIIDLLLGVPNKTREDWKITRNRRHYKVRWSIRKTGGMGNRFREIIEVRSGPSLVVRSKAFTTVIRRKDFTSVIKRAGFHAKYWFKPFVKNALDRPPVRGRIVVVIEKR